MDVIETEVLEEDASAVTGQIVASDIDKEAVLTYEVNAAIAGFTLNADGSYGFDAGDEAYQHLEKDVVEVVTAVVSVQDEFGASSTVNLSFRLTGTNDIPVVENITTQNLLEDTATITGNIVSADVDDNAVLTYATTQTVAGFTLNSNGTYSFDASDEAYQSLKKDEIQEITIAVTVTDEHGAVDSKDLVITLTGTNDTPTVEVIESSDVNEDANIITGQVEAFDIDKDAVLTYTSTSVAGFSLNNDGSYSFDASNEAYQHLAQGAKETVSIEVTISDEHAATTSTNIVFELTGTNDTPIVENLTALRVEEDETVVTGAVEANDVDDNSVLSYATTANIAGFRLNSDGSYSFDASDASYQSLSVGEVRNFIVPIVVSDEQGAEVSRFLSIQITGTNDAPTVAIIQESVTLTDELSKEGTIAVSDVDNTSFTYEVSINGEHGSISIDENGKWIYEVDSTYRGDDRAVITVTDEDGASVDKTIEFTVDNNPINGTDGKDKVRGTNENDVLNGLAGDDKLYGYGGNDKLFGGSGNDTLYGDKGADELHGGTGDDYLKGDYGSDTYYFNIGDGNDTIKDKAKRRSYDQDKIVFGEGISQEDLKVTKSGHDLILTINEDDSIKVKYWFSNDKYKIETLEFSDGSSLNSTELDELIIIEGTDKKDRLRGSNSMNDTIYAYGGNDKLYGYDGDDKLYGGEGKDSLYGDKGVDSLYGGTGDDYLKGGYGSDTYYFEQGDGEDTIKDKSKSRSYDTDSIVFGESVSAEDISFIFDKKDLLIQYGDGDEIEIKYQTKDKYAIERVELADGNYLSSGDIDNIVQQIHAYADDNGLDIDSNQDIRANAALTQIIQSAWHQ